MKLILRTALLAGLSLILSCGHQTGVAANPDADPQKLPFDRKPQPSGITPSRSFIPAVTRLPEGTALTVFLEHSLSSGSARARDSFTAVLSDPIVVDGQTVVPRGAPVTGRVLDARRATRSYEPGYLRVALETITIAGKQIPIATSSLFAKAGSHDERASAMVQETGSAVSARAPASREIVFTPDRRLSFRLTRTVDLQ